MTGMEAHAATDAPNLNDKSPEAQQGEEETSAITGGQKNAVSSTSILSKFPFVRSTSTTSARTRQDKDRNGGQVHERDPLQSIPGSMATVVQQQQPKTRRRRGSLRKVALLGRGLQRRDAKQLTIDTSYAAAGDLRTFKQLQRPQLLPEAPAITTQQQRDEPRLSAPVSDSTSKPHTKQPAGSSTFPSATISSATPSNGTDHAVESSFFAQNTYSSTTDEEDILHLPGHDTPAAHPELLLSSGSESYFGERAATQSLRRRSMMRAKSPLSYSGLSNTPIPPTEAEYDYSETEFWGWVVLIVTWIVFVVGMGSCLGIWSWAWDVGITPYAPPELEDDPTLPIVGYYPALIILTCIMAWVWVIIAWVGMKYFRHAKISGD
ncbi:hypothetical protein SODALDRAFT_106526 [Sodiomyces alkalinus F11]|uniref:Uncharacterized protein n=1 Tax=Sodiomyces alkalinus (strain CBS 110278 / VKM F-3762 / F11) TaxID=1314773 RepID=A0A3N2Q2D0_SODAK|nr:hypothetical protein SODALDRAFT_106526 [Sodiomyces alkalinus F11]ROT40876.1 hypothetical protein SODALDRAFT_106526 [Sodiomyces alkalinus F11]